MKFKVDASAVEKKLNVKQETKLVNFMADNDTIHKLKLLQKHYNVKNRSNLLQALIHGAAEAIR